MPFFCARDHSLAFRSYGTKKKVTTKQFSVIITIKSLCDIFHPLSVDWVHYVFVKIVYGYYICDCSVGAPSLSEA